MQSYSVLLQSASTQEAKNQLTWDARAQHIVEQEKLNREAAHIHQEYQKLSLKTCFNLAIAELRKRLKDLQLTEIRDAAEQVLQFAMQMKDSHDFTIEQLIDVIETVSLAINQLTHPDLFNTSKIQQTASKLCVLVEQLGGQELKYRNIGLAIMTIGFVLMMAAILTAIGLAVIAAPFSALIWGACGIGLGFAITILGSYVADRHRNEYNERGYLTEASMSQTFARNAAQPGLAGKLCAFSSLFYQASKTIPKQDIKLDIENTPALTLG